MLRQLKTIFYLTLCMLGGSAVLWNCEPDTDRLGEQFFNGNGIDVNEVSYDVIAYNINNNDSLRSDAVMLKTAVLGAFSESVFGMQKASFVAQARMAKYNPDFGTNAVVDSVVLVMKPLYVSDSVTTSTDENYIYPDGNIDAKKVVKTYPVVKYGKKKIGGATPNFTIQVHEVSDFLGGYAEKSYSNKVIGLSPAMLGTKTFNGNVNSVVVTKKDGGSELLNIPASFRMNLNASFFQNKIISKQGSVDLKDAANFIRYFKGIKVSVVENDGYLFGISPSDISIIMYYKFDKDVNGTPTPTPASFSFPLGTDISTRIGLYEYDRSGTLMQSALANTNPVTGDPKLYLQGMGGPSLGIKIPQSTVNDLKTIYKNDKAAIITAKIRLYTDVVQWNTSYGKPNALTVVHKDGAKVNMLKDLSVLGSAANFTLLRTYDLDKNPAYYDFTITKTVKDIIESDEVNQPVIVDVGSFLTNSSTGNFYSPEYTSRPYTPNRMVLVGTDPGNPYRVQLKLIYGTK